MYDPVIRDVRYQPQNNASQMLVSNVVIRNPRDFVIGLEGELGIATLVGISLEPVFVALR
ncbi:hypothetical protein [Phyllobacterium leguminum]|uniref:hypothetical protein n=1 Tax=Phyllobacterium leguminum TaxID=314237 RepID=UPI0011B64C2C|nr:hypothetical protein [Phyllobacterium leguminum]